MFQIEAIDHVALYVQDVQQSIQWYQEVLGMQQHYLYKASPGLENPVEMRAGQVSIALFPTSPEQPAQHFSGHIALRLSRENFEQAQAHLHTLGIDFGSVVHYTRCDAIYFDDPSGYQIELSTWFEPQ